MITPLGHVSGQAHAHAHAKETTCDQDASHTGCSNMHAAYSYDAIWGWAFTLHRWLAAGNKPESVDYVTGTARKSWFALEVCVLPIPAHAACLLIECSILNMHLG